MCLKQNYVGVFSQRKKYGSKSEVKNQHITVMQEQDEGQVSWDGLVELQRGEKNFLGESQYTDLPGIDQIHFLKYGESV
jgi:hypothetical protein